MHESINDGLLRLKHQQEILEAVGEDMKTERQRFQAIANREPTRAISAFNLFQTPPKIADLMARTLGKRKRVLEPSAGLGRLTRAIKSDSIVQVEINPDCCSELYRNGHQLYQRDFLDCSPDELGLFDGVLMNPPFKQGRDIKHVCRAMSFLAPGGMLVALCFDGVRQNKILKPMMDSWEVLPERSFAGEGTRASVALTTWVKK